MKRNTAHIDHARQRATSPRLAIGGIVVLVGLSIALSILAARTKSPTMDEPLHVTGAFAHVFHRDYRVNPEDPPLWNYWAMLPHGRASLRLDFHDPDWAQALGQTEYQSRFSTRTLFQSGNDGVALIQRSRIMMALLAGVLPIVVAWWSWRLGGAMAALIATALICLDPNFLAHAPLIKNDVAISLVLFTLAMATWSAARRLTWWNALLCGLICAAGMVTKFSGVLVAAIFAVTIILRALMPLPWVAFGQTFSSRAAKLGIALGWCAGTAVLSWAIIWATYGFRFDATPVPGSRLPMAAQVRGTLESLHFLEHGRYPSRDEVDAAPRPLTVRAILWAERNRLLPQPWLYGFLFTYRSTLMRGSFLLGEHSELGWWYYFPLAMLFKTPLATLLAIAVAIVAAVMMFIRRRRSPDGSNTERLLDPLAALCIAVPVIVYGLSALTSHLNLGIRHVLPLYPFIYLLVGVSFARIREWFPRSFKYIAAALLVGLAVESLLAFPHYLSFFNAAARPHRLRLLSDSNLDWGQDLPAQRAWQIDHPGEKLYFGYFGTTDPAVYGIQYHNLPGGFWMGPPFEWPDPREDAVIAISATLLQGANAPPSLRYYYAPLREIEPREVLGGGSIYLFDLPLPPGVELKLPAR